MEGWSGELGIELASGLPRGLPPHPLCIASCVRAQLMNRNTWGCEVWLASRLPRKFLLVLCAQTHASVLFAHADLNQVLPTHPNVAQRQPVHVRPQRKIQKQHTPRTVPSLLSKREQSYQNGRHLNARLRCNVQGPRRCTPACPNLKPSHYFESLDL